MYNASRSGAVSDTVSGLKEATVRDAERAGKVGDKVEDRAFTIRPKTGTIEICAGRVAVKFENSSEA